MKTKLDKAGAKRAREKKAENVGGSQMRFENDRERALIHNPAV